MHHETRHLYVWNRVLLQLAPGVLNSRHRHFGAFLLMAPDAPIHIDLDHHPTVTTQAAVIGPNAWHRLDSRNSRVATLLIGADDPWFGYVLPLLQGNSIRALDYERVQRTCEWDRLFAGDFDSEEARAHIEVMLAALIDASFQPYQLDPRIADAVDALNDDEVLLTNLAALAARTDLSAITFMRHFKRQLGVRIREYALWRRLLRAVPMFNGSRSLTEIAQLAGFYDQAHLTRTARRMFDLQPSNLYGPSRTIVHASKNSRSL